MFHTNMKHGMTFFVQNTLISFAITRRKAWYFLFYFVREAPWILGNNFLVCVRLSKSLEIACHKASYSWFYFVRLFKSFTITGGMKFFVFKRSLKSFAITWVMPHGIKSLRSKILCNDLTQVMTLFIFCVSKIPQIFRNNLTQCMTFFVIFSHVPQKSFAITWRKVWEFLLCLI